MSLLTVPVFAAVCPRCPTGRLTAIVAALRTAFETSTITTPARLAAFLAQAAHESGEFRWWQESWGPTEAQKRYEPPHDKAVELGNVQTGDGFRYRGRGPFQLTGRANYRACGDRLGYPLEADPDLVAEIPVGCLSAVDFWDAHRFSTLADVETLASFRRLTQRLNGGANGLPQREAYHAAARQVLGLAALKE